MAYTPKEPALRAKCRRCGVRGALYCLIEGSPVETVTMGCHACGHKFVKTFGAPKAVIETTGETVSEGRAA